jgi:hypothetical protein
MFELDVEGCRFGLGFLICGLEVCVFVIFVFALVLRLGF